MTITAKIPLWDGANTSKIMGSRIYNSVAEEMRLFLLGVSDDFNDNSIDTAKWTETDGGTNITETNQRLQTTGTNGWQQNGLCSKSGWTAGNGLELDFQIIPNHWNVIGGFSQYSTLELPTNGQNCFIYADSASSGIWRVHINGTAVATAYVCTLGKTYNVRIVYNSGWEVYVQSPDHSAYSTEVMIYKTLTTSSGTMYIQINDYSTGSVNIWDNVIAYASGFPSDSPSPTGVWASLPTGSVIDMSTLRIPELMNYGDAGSIEYKYAYNGGGFSSFKSQVNMRLEADITVSDATNSFQIVPRLNSSGTQLATVRTFAEVNVTLPTGGSSGGLMINPGLSGGLR